MPIGGVIDTNGVVLTNTAGVDIGCGMYALKYYLVGLDRDSLKKVMTNIQKNITLGRDCSTANKDETLMPQVDNMPNNGAQTGTPRTGLGSRNQTN